MDVMSLTMKKREINQIIQETINRSTRKSNCGRDNNQFTLYSNESGRATKVKKEVTILVPQSNVRLWSQSTYNVYLFNV